MIRIGVIRSFATAASHDSGIIHRDVKPSNIIRRQKDGKLILIDFGMVEEKTTDFPSNNLAQIVPSKYSVGTRGYAPPEQLALRPVYASDIYSLGVTTIYLMTGKKPANIGLNPNTGEVMWLKDLEIGDRFGNLLSKMLDVSVEKRYQTAEEVLQDLNQVI